MEDDLDTLIRNLGGDPSSGAPPPPSFLSRKPKSTSFVLSFICSCYFLSPFRSFFLFPSFFPCPLFPSPFSFPFFLFLFLSLFPSPLSFPSFLPLFPSPLSFPSFLPLFLSPLSFPPLLSLFSFFLFLFPSLF